MKKTQKKMTKRSTKQIEIYRNNLAGVQYSDYQQAIKRKLLNVGCSLSLVWERNNKFDDRAISVRVKGIHIGYIRAADTEELHQYREQGIKLTTRLVANNATNPTWYMFTIAVTAPRSLTTDNDSIPF